MRLNTKHVRKVGDMCNNHICIYVSVSLSQHSQSFTNVKNVVFIP